MVVLSLHVSRLGRTAGRFVGLALLASLLFIPTHARIPPVGTPPPGPETTDDELPLEPAPQPTTDPAERVGATPSLRPVPETARTAATEPAASPSARRAPHVPTPVNALKERLADAGVASTYGLGDGFQGRRTACGQIFDTHVPQTAHKVLPCGTILRVEDANNGRSVSVEVTDRGPYVPRRVVDLSWAAYRQLDPRGPGLRRVRVYRQASPD
jgi:rare lipoprotein A